MNLKSDIRPISYVKSNAAELLKQINETHNPVVITQNGEARAVLLDTDSYQQMRDAIGILGLVAQGENDVAAGRTIDHEELMRRSKADLAARNGNSGGST